MKAREVLVTNWTSVKLRQTLKPTSTPLSASGSLHATYTELESTATAAGVANPSGAASGVRTVIVALRPQPPLVHDCVTSAYCVYGASEPIRQPLNSVGDRSDARAFRVVHWPFRSTELFSNTTFAAAGPVHCTPTLAATSAVTTGAGTPDGGASRV